MPPVSAFLLVKGTVFDLFSEDTICVYIEDFGEIVNMPLSHVSAVWLLNCKTVFLIRLCPTKFLFIDELDFVPFLNYITIL
jgi:hypothetical protein